MKSVNIFILRILSNKKTFDKLYDSNYKENNDKIIITLNEIIEKLVNNLLMYNSFKSETENLLVNIFKNLYDYSNNLIIKNEKNAIYQSSKEIDYIFNLINQIIFKYLLKSSDGIGNMKLQK